MLLFNLITLIVWFVMFQLRLKSFRGIVKGSINLDKVNIILGSNNSGKSTILEALFLISNPFRFVPYMFLVNNKIWRRLRAIEVIHELHKTLESKGFAFLLNSYKAEEFPQ